MQSYNNKNPYKTDNHPLNIESMSNQNEKKLLNESEIYYTLLQNHIINVQSSVIGYAASSGGIKQCIHDDVRGYETKIWWNKYT